MLIEQLRALQEHGLVSRQSTGQDARGVDYVLTPLGRSLQPVLEVFKTGENITPRNLIKPTNWYRASLSSATSHDFILEKPQLSRWSVDREALLHPFISDSRQWFFLRMARSTRDA